MLGLLFLLPFFLWEFSTVPPVHFDTKALLSIIYVGVFASLTAFLLWNKAIVSIGPSKSGMIYYSLPLFSGFWAFVLLKEHIGTLHILCGLLIVSGIFTANHSRKAPPLKGAER